MAQNSLIIKALVLAAVSSYFAYSVYWFVKTIPWIVTISLGPEHYSPATGLRFIDSYSVSAAYMMEYTGFFGLMIRVVGASYAMFAVFLFLKNKKDLSHTIQNRISKALFLEGCYYLSFIPAIIFMLLNFSALPAISNFLLSTVFVIQIFLITPLFIKLAITVKNYGIGVDRPLLIRWIGLTYMSFAIALWFTYMLKWREMMFVDPYLFSALSVRILGFLNTVIVQSLAVIFAVVAVLLILRKRSSYEAIRWLGLSAIFLSLHVLIYVIYVTQVGVTRFIPFGELWLIPLIGVGLYLLLKKRQ